MLMLMKYNNKICPIIREHPVSSCMLFICQLSKTSISTHMNLIRNREKKQLFLFSLFDCFQTFHNQFDHLKMIKYI
jgi:hypothetical protein